MCKKLPLKSLFLGIILILIFLSDKRKSKIKKSLYKQIRQTALNIIQRLLKDFIRKGVIRYL
ncbi:hypothetical protein CCPUN_03630 [Cardinium endosymbiont of Culicoides punctatus]|nr:hypothetical protein CCPUN_03630 [Cardinium endosymbiont of Culicoides punctatus]